MPNPRVHWRASSKEKNQQVEDAATRRGMTVSEYSRYVTEREAKDDNEEAAANARRAALHEKEKEEFERSIADIPAGRPMPPKPSREPPKDPGALLTWEEYDIEYAEAMQAYKSRLDRLSHCAHKGVTPGALCPKCRQIYKPRGSQGRVLTKPRISFHVPTGKGGIT